MKLTLSAMGIVEAEVLRHDALLELKQRGNKGIRRLRKGVYPRSQFGYSNYKVDPRPDVLKLGVWVHPKTKNALLGGVNLNYLSARQTSKLKSLAKQIFARGTLRSRYRYLKKKLPDIAQYYRTYDKDYIYSDQPDEFKDYDYRDVKEPDTQDAETKQQADTNKIDDLASDVEVEPEDNIDTSIDKDREAWAAKRRLYNPDTGRRTKPERAKQQQDIPHTKREKLNRYRSQRRKMKQLENDAEIERVAAALKKDDEKKIDKYEEPSTEVPRQSELGPYESIDYRYSPDLGFIWKSRAAYIRYHNPDNFHLIREFCRGDILAVHDIISGQTVVDAVPDRAFILESTGWDYYHTVLIEKCDDELVFSSEVDQPVLMEFLSGLNYSRIATVLSE